MSSSGAAGANQRLRSAKNRRGGQTAPTSALPATCFVRPWDGTQYASPSAGSEWHVPPPLGPSKAG